MKRATKTILYSKPQRSEYGTENTGEKEKMKEDVEGKHWESVFNDLPEGVFYLKSDISVRDCQTNSLR